MRQEMLKRYRSLGRLIWSFGVYKSLGTSFWDAMGLPWVHVGRHWVPFGCPWTCFGSLRGALGCPWAPFGMPWGALGLPLVPLGASFARLGDTPCAALAPSRFCSKGVAIFRVNVAEPPRLRTETSLREHSTRASGAAGNGAWKCSSGPAFHTRRGSG